MNEGILGPLLAGGMPLGENRGISVRDPYGFCGAAPHIVSWFDVRVFYVRVSSCPLDDAPDVLTMRYPPREITTELEVNGGRISPSEEAILILKRDRVDTDSSEATYVSTDNLRTTSLVAFEILDKDVLLLSGHFEDASTAGDVQDATDKQAASLSSKLGWIIECQCALEVPAGPFFKGRHEFSTASLSPPTVEVCVVGRYAGSPIILTEIVHLTVRRRTIRRGTLEAIVEGDEGDKFQNNLMLVDPSQNVEEQERLFQDGARKTVIGLGTLYGSEIGRYGDSDDGELSWFNAGVRVGVGIGLGMCLGIGIGVGLMVRTYQATTRSFRRGLF